MNEEKFLLDVGSLVFSNEQDGGEQFVAPEVSPVFSKIHYIAHGIISNGPSIVYLQ
jgi:hypothetical protein